MIPILYAEDELNFTTNGLGKLSDCIDPNVHEERNGEFELELEYPVDGQHYADLDDHMIILAKPNPYMQTQPFRIYSISRPMNGIVEVSARHVSSDLSGVVVKPFSAATVAASFAAMKANATPAIPQFTFSTDKTTTSTMWVKKPSSFKSLLGGVKGSILDSFGGGEYIFDRFRIELKNARGTDRGFSIRYGKNLVSLKQNQNCESVYTAVYPFYFSNDELIDLGTTINVQGDFDFERVLSLDLTDKFDEPPTKEQLRAAAVKYIEDNDIGRPKVNLKVDFVKLSQYSGYEEFEPLEDIRLCDTVSIFFEKLGISTSAKCIAMDFNPLTERITSIELGDAKNTLADTIADQETMWRDQGSITGLVNGEVSRATQLITGNKGGHLLIWNSETRLPQYPNELLIMDKDTVAESTKIWRFNKSGWGYSSNGYNGSFNLAATMEGEINADFIKAGKITGIEIDNGSGTFKVDSSGNLTANSATLTGSFSAGRTKIDTSGNFTVKDVNNAEVFKISSTGAVKLGSMKIATNGAFSVGPQASYSTSAPFYVTDAGVLHANGAVLNGSFTAENTQTGYKVQMADDGLLHFFYNGTDYGQMYVQDGSLWIKYDDASIRLFYNPTNNTIQMDCGQALLRIEHVSNGLGQTLDDIFVKAGNTMLSMGNNSISIMSGTGSGFKADSTGAYAVVNGTQTKLA